MIFGFSKVNNYLRTLVICNLDGDSFQGFFGGCYADFEIFLARILWSDEG